MAIVNPEVEYVEGYNSNPETIDVNQISVDNGVDLGDATISYSAEVQFEDWYRKEAIQSPCQDSSANKKGIQLIIQNLQNDITRIQKNSKRFSTLNGAVSALVNEDVPGPGKEIKRIVDFATGDISGYIRNMLDPLRSYVMTKIQEKVKKILPFLFPGEMPSFLDKLKKGTDFIQCAFSKVINLLFKTIGELLLDFLDKFINGPLCAIQEFVSNLLDQILSPIIDSVESVLNVIGEAIGNLATSILNALDFINDLIDFFKCETKPECPVVDSINLSGTSNAIPKSSKISKFSFGIGEDLPIPACPTNPIPCGPPRVEFFGGGGFGELVNPIVSPNSSSIIGFDIVNPGVGFLKRPIANIVDDCGSGSGSSLLVIMEPSTGLGTTASNIGLGATASNIGLGATGSNVGLVTSGLQIKNIIILSPGNGYLSSPNGSLGGNGRVWKNVNEGYVKRKDGSFYVVPDGNPPSNLPEGDQFFPPQVPDQFETLTYPVVLEIGEVYIQDGGFGYSDGDTLTVSPNNGAELEPIINGRGEIESINVVNPGIGFVDIPEIIVNSVNGYNAKLIPVLNSIRIDQIEDPTLIPPQTQVISVVDCVGKIAPKSTFDRIPR